MGPTGKHALFTGGGPASAECTGFGGNGARCKRSPARRQEVLDEGCGDNMTAMAEDVRSEDTWWPRSPPARQSPGPIQICIPKPGMPGQGRA